MDLGIQHQTCNQCGAMIYPQSIISTKGEKVKVEIIDILKLVSSLTDDELMTLEKYNDIQNGLYDNRPDLDLTQFKGKTYSETVNIRKVKFQTMRDNKIAEANKKEKEYKKIGIGVSQPISKKVTRVETETEVTLNVERYLAVLEGNESTGNQKCPICGFVLVSWNK